MSKIKEDPAVEWALEVDKLKKSGGDFHSRLEVDDRVLARITDGIYRRPSAALRELIFNAYDADATSVIIDTDYPRFEYISVKDNGNGMDERSLTNLFAHIGGSSKRTQKGKILGTVHATDPELTPGRRRLIGKIGIGMFAVTHLTTHFRVITKKADSKYRFVAEVWLKTWTEERLKNEVSEDSEEFVTGDVAFSVEPASDVLSHGTEVVLLDIRNSTKDSLRSADFWKLFMEAKSSEDPSDRRLERDPPAYHIGYSGDSKEYFVEPNLPWNDSAQPLEKFESIYQKVISGTGTSVKNPDIEEYFDNYVGMIWMLSLTAPIEYIEENPFRFGKNKTIDYYKIENKPRGQAVVLELDEGRSLGETFNLESDKPDPCGGFRVQIDGVEIRRPVVLPETLVGARKKNRIKNPLMFVGKVVTTLGSVPSDLGGGPLEFEAYFYWNSLIVPKQNRGVLIRINNASGVLYDDRFMDYQISELNRLTQITAEIFINKGLDPALNIDRESFNISHPHYQYLSKWVHAALRQITNKLKDLGKKSRTEELTNAKSEFLSAVHHHLEDVWERKGDSLASRPDVTVLPIAESKDMWESTPSSGELIFKLDPELIAQTKNRGNASLEPLELTKSVMSVLHAYGLLENLPPEFIE